MTATHPAPRSTVGALRSARAAEAEEAPAVAGVYLLAFFRVGEHVMYPPVLGHRHTGALHYCGFSDNVRERIAEHRAGRGGRLCRAAILAGYELRLVRVWPGRGREYERALKARHRLGAFCPECWYAAGSPAAWAPLGAPAAPAAAASDAPTGLWGMATAMEHREEAGRC